MTQIAQAYHNNLQTVGLATGEELQQTTEHALNNITRKMLPGDKQILSQPLQEEEVNEALKKLALGKAAGMDGIPSELWKILQEHHDEAHQANEQEQQNQAVNIVKVLTTVFNDIKTYGVSNNTEFSLGWMCPIYKKNDKKKHCKLQTHNCSKLRL